MSLDHLRGDTRRTPGGVQFRDTRYMTNWTFDHCGSPELHLPLRYDARKILQVHEITRSIPSLCDPRANSQAARLNPEKLWNGTRQPGFSCRALNRDGGKDTDLRLAIGFGR